MAVAIDDMDLGQPNLFPAMGAAVTKATLVVLFFMHAWWSDRLVKVTIITAIVFLMILFAFPLTDYLSRGLLGVAGK